MAHIPKNVQSHKVTKKKLNKKNWGFLLSEFLVFKMIKFILDKNKESR